MLTTAASAARVRSLSALCWMYWVTRRSLAPGRLLVHPCSCGLLCAFGVGVLISPSLPRCRGQQTCRSDWTRWRAGKYAFLGRGGGGARAASSVRRSDVDRDSDDCPTLIGCRFGRRER